MKINVLSSTSFHVLPLAKELQRQGLDVRFYSYLPYTTTRKAGLKKGTAVSLLWLVAPLVFLLKILPYKKIRITMIINKLLDGYCCRYMRKADIVIALGSVYLNVLEKAKCNSSITILEWGSKHIIEQRKNLGIPDSLNHDVLERELKSYEIADYIAVASQHVAYSFIKHGIPEKKLLVNPYGVDLAEFPPTQLDMEEQYDLIFVGGWRYEKGADLLIELCQNYGYSLLHVGRLVNMPFPEQNNMKHIASVPQSELTNYYKKAKVFVLPSRAEGLSLVQVQAIGSGLAVVCSKETGGSDLRKLIDDQRWILEMKELTVEELNRCVIEALKLTESQCGVRNYTNMENLTWKKYGERYAQNIQRITNKS